MSKYRSFKDKAFVDSITEGTAEDVQLKNYANLHKSAKFPFPGVCVCLWLVVCL